MPDEPNDKPLNPSVPTHAAPTSPQAGPVMPAPSATKPVSPRSKTSQPLDPAHVPMTEEFDKARWTLPPWQPVAVALGIVAVVVAVLSFVTRAKPPAAGGIDNITAVQVPPGDSVLVGISLNFTNNGQKPLWVHTIKATLKTEKGEWSDDAAAAVDYDRYFQAFPDLKQNAEVPLIPEMRVPPGAQQKGMVIVSFPVAKDQFEQRKSLSVTIQPYDQKAVVLTR